MSSVFYNKLICICHDFLSHDKEVQDYLKKRNIKNETIIKYKIGVFPKDIYKLFHYLDPIELKNNNIIWDANNSQFSNHRLVIPIFDAYNNPIAIGCRTLFGEEERKKNKIPKYKNSVYKKTLQLFGLNYAKNYIRKKNCAYVVEGYFDVISAHQNGIMNVVASCGTIFSSKQAVILSRYCDNINLLFDNDEPGRNSANRVTNKIEHIKFLPAIKTKFVPKGKDLDEFVNMEKDNARLFFQS